MTCKMCKERGQTWRGDAPKCSFPDGGPFSSVGWNCATAGAIRSLCGDDVTVYCDDQKYATLNVSEVGFGDVERPYALALWVSWYKQRGRTEAMWLLSQYDAPRLPTEADCLAIIAAVTAMKPRVAVEGVARDTTSEILLLNQTS